MKQARQEKEENLVRSSGDQGRLSFDSFGGVF